MEAGRGMNEFGDKSFARMLLLSHECQSALSFVNNIHSLFICNSCSILTYVTLLHAHLDIGLSERVRVYSLEAK